MTSTTIEQGISVIRDSTGRKIGYEVEGWTRTFRTLRAARLARKKAL